MPVSLEKDGALSRIRFQGAIGIGCAAELKELLVQGLNSSSEVCVLLADATYLDVTAVQLMWTARCAAMALGVRFRLEGQLPEALSAALSETGLTEVLFTA